ncbi:MAG TPA: AzlC family ABC transporter permease, partial [Marmoricola sp.]|nr:AzlC family ABC transporter permease [Marmoricola sp.]
ILTTFVVNLRHALYAVTLAPYVRGLLQRWLIALGFLLTDETFLLAWWQGDDKERIPESIALVQSTDYSRQEWFRTPQRTHASHVTGPYIDYVCTDEFMLTVTVPVERNDQMLGVMGADILAETVERILLDQFQQSGATLANHHGRVVLSADPRVFAGEPISPDQYDVQIPCADLPLTVLATTQEPK